MIRFMTLILVLVMAAPAAFAQRQTADEDPPRRTVPRVIERPVTVAPPAAAPETAAPETDAPVMRATAGRDRTITDAAFEAGVTADDYDVGGRWACGCEGEDNGRCRAIIEGRSLTCYPAEEGGCTTSCDLATTHDPQIGAGPRSVAGD